MARASGETLDALAAEHNFEIPRPIPGVLDSWIAFLKVYDCRHFGGMGVPTTPQWGDIATRLSVHGLWSAEREEQLALLFRELLKVESDNRKQQGGVGDGGNKSSHHV